MPEFAAHLIDSLRVLSLEQPRVHESLCALLDRREVLLAVDGEQVAVRGEKALLEVDHHPRAPSVELETDRLTILALADAQLTVAEAILADRVRLRGALDELIRFHDALILYLQGAVRSPSFSVLLRRFRKGEAPWST